MNATVLPSIPPTDDHPLVTLISPRIMGIAPLLAELRAQGVVVLDVLTAEEVETIRPDLSEAEVARALQAVSEEGYAVRVSGVPGVAAARREMVDDAVRRSRQDDARIMSADGG